MREAGGGDFLFYLSNTLLLEEADALCLCLSHTHAVEIKTVDTAVDERAVSRVGQLGIASAVDNLNDREVKLDGKLIVTGIVRGNSHNGASAVGGEDVVGHPHRDGLASEGIGRVRACEEAGLVLLELCKQIGDA